MKHDDLHPETQAEIAALIFESQEKDRWMRLHSFMYRHQGWFMAVSWLLIIGAIVAMFIDGYDPNTVGRMYAYLIAGWTGIILLYSSFFISDSKNGFSAILKAILTLTALIVVALPFYAGFLALVTRLAS